MIQALFDTLNASIKTDMHGADTQIHSLLAKAEVLQTLLGEALGDHHMDRITLYVVCFMTLFVCFMTVLGKNNIGNDIITRIDQVANQSNIMMPEREPLRSNHMSSLSNMPTFSFPDGMSPPLGIKAIQQQNELVATNLEQEEKRM